MNLASFDAVLYAILFLVPGFIWSWVHSWIIPRRAKAWEARTIEFLTLSCINHAIWIWYILPVFRGGISGVGAVLLVVPLLISPLAFGLLSGLAYQRNWAARFFERLRINPVHPIPTAWDYQFSRGFRYWVAV